MKKLEIYYSNYVYSDNSDTIFWWVGWIKMLTIMVDHCGKFFYITLAKCSKTSILNLSNRINGYLGKHIGFTVFLLISALGAYQILKLLCPALISGWR